MTPASLPWSRAWRSVSPRLRPRCAYARAVRLTSVVVVLVSLAAQAQSTCFTAFGGDGGWVGNFTQVSCVCGGCDRVRFEFRPAAGTWGGAGSLDVEVGPNDRPLFVHPLTHGADYAWRATPLLPDGGTLPTSLEVPVRADLIDPLPPVSVALDALDGGLYMLSFPPGTDDGSGIERYEVLAAWSDAPQAKVVVASGASSPVPGDLGPGRWQLALQPIDGVGNRSGTVALAQVVTTTFDLALSAPRAPVNLEAAVQAKPGVDYEVQDPADAYHFLLVAEDGGVRAGFANRFTPSSIPSRVFGSFETECRWRVRSARVLGDMVSDWAAPSDPITIDLRPPPAPASTSVSSAAEQVALSWAPAVDGCSGVTGYDVQRDDGAGFADAGAVATPGYLDTLPAPGRYVYRVRAVDAAGHRGAWSQEVEVRWSPDAGGSTGDDAGTSGPDGGVPGDAGVSGSDAGAPGGDAGVPAGAADFQVACGCAGVGGGEGLVALALLLARSACGRRRRTSHGAPAAAERRAGQASSGRVGTAHDVEGA